MHSTTLFISLIADLFLILAITFTLVMLKIEDKTTKESKKIIWFERFERERIFKNSLAILTLSVIFSSLSLYGGLAHTFGHYTVEWLHIAGKVFLILFVIYVLGVLKFTKPN